MSVTTDFTTRQEAVETYYGDTGPGDSRPGGDTGGTGSSQNQNSGSDDRVFGELQEVQTDWVGGWGLFYQPNTASESTRQWRESRRWFVFRVIDGQTQALQMSGQTTDVADTDPLDTLPSTTAESEARQAYQTWVDENDPDGSEEPDNASWGDWQEVEKINGWFIFMREHGSREDDNQWLAAGVPGDSEQESVFLQPDGSIGDQPHIFEERGELDAAIEAYRGRSNRGETDTGREPTGTSPPTGGFPKSGGKAGVGGAVGQAVDSVGGTRNALILVALVGGGIYYLERTGRIDISGTLEEMT